MTKLNPRKPLPDFIEDFLRYKEKIEKFSEKSVIAYQQDLYSFCEWLMEYRQQNSVIPDMLNNLTSQDMMKWRFTLQNQASTEGRKVSSLRSLFNYLNDTVKLINNQVMKDVHKPKMPKGNRIKYLTSDVAKEFVDAVKLEGTLQEFAIVKLFFNSGVRISELVNLNINSLSGNVLTVIGKGNKPREIVLPQDTIDVINQWLHERPKVTTNAMFIMSYFNKEPYRITGTGIRNMTKKYATMLGIKNFTPHGYRHTYGTSKRESGVSLDTLKELMGHERIETLYIYAKVTRKEKELVADMGSI